MTRSATTTSLCIRGKSVPFGDVVAAGAPAHGLKYLYFRVSRLQAGRSLEASTGPNETVLVVISGAMSVDSAHGSWDRVGGRADPFSGPPAAVYLPGATRYTVRAVTDLEVAICGAPERAPFPARFIEPSKAGERVRGDGQATRHIRDIMMQDDEAGSLFVTEVVTPPGNWSSYPPHKHDQDNLPDESELEEVYYYRAKPAQGFAFQRVYTSSGDIDETMTARDTDLVLVPRGYHVCAAAANYSIYYLNVLAGPKHVYRMTFDPPHAWIKEHWTW